MKSSSDYSSTEAFAMSLVRGALAPLSWHGLSRELHNGSYRACVTLHMIPWVVWIGGC